MAGVNDYRFPSLYGSLRWDENAFEVWDAGSRFYGGAAAFKYAIRPFGSKTKPTHHFDATLTDVDLARFSDFEELRGRAIRRHGRPCTTCSSGRPAGSPNIAAKATWS